jgi:hypothetical protein
MAAMALNMNMGDYGPLHVRLKVQIVTGARNLARSCHATTTRWSGHEDASSYNVQDRVAIVNRNKQ